MKNCELHCQIKMVVQYKTIQKEEEKTALVFQGSNKAQDLAINASLKK